MQNELKPCPFCGGNNLRFRLSDIEGWIAHVECTDCDDMLGPMSEWKHDEKEDAEKDAAAVWNKRPAIEAALSAAEPSVVVKAILAELDNVLVNDEQDRETLAKIRTMVSALSEQVQDVATAEPIAWESTTVGYIKYVTNKRYQKFSDAVKKWYRPIPSPIPEGWQLAPKVSTAEMEDAARHLMLWLDFTRPTEASLISHCKRLGKEPPPECKDVDHVPSKAMRLFWVYRAMLAAAPAAKLGEKQ